MTFSFEDETLVQQLRDAVGSLETPRLRNDALARILARRANGERIALRTVDDPRDGRGRVGWLTSTLLASAAAIAVAAVVLPRGGSVTASNHDNVAFATVDSACANAPVTAGDSSVLRRLMISAFGIPAACGAEPGRDGPIAYDASQIKSGTFTYASLSITDGVFTSKHPPFVIMISRITWKGVRAILAVRDSPLLTGVHLDSLIVSADGPTPLYFASIYHTQRPPGAIHADFDSTMITIAMTGHLDTVAIFPFRMKSGQLPFGFALPLAVPALPLALGWHGVIEIAPPIHPRAFKYFLRPWETISLRVVGRETIRVAAGVFDCWKVRVGEPEDGSVIWVSKSNHLVIRSVSVSRSGETSFEDRHELESAKFYSQ